MSAHKPILLVEDEVDLLELLAEFLRKNGFEVITATNGKLAYEILSERNTTLGAPIIHAVITDWMMPEMNGIELLNKIRNAGAFSGIPVVLMSGAVTKHELEPILKAGADGILLKPFQNSVLLDKLNSSVAIREGKEIEKMLKG